MHIVSILLFAYYILLVNIYTYIKEDKAISLYVYFELYYRYFYCYKNVYK